MIGGPEWGGRLPLGRGVVLLARDANGLMAFDKPAGVLSHPNAPGDEPRSLLAAPYRAADECYEWTDSVGPAEPRRLWLVNRLDSATSGVILAAAGEDLATAVRAQFEKKQVRKVYQALVFGAPPRTVEYWRDLLQIEKRGGMIRTSARAGQVPAESQMSVIRRGQRQPRVTLIRLEPRTGRSHQLRVQCAKRGLPIVGDQTYGDFARNREFARLVRTKRLFLHSLETSFDYEYRGGPHRFSVRAPLPPEFEEYL